MCRKGGTEKFLFSSSAGSQFIVSLVGSFLLVLLSIWESRYGRKIARHRANKTTFLVRSFVQARLSDHTPHPKTSKASGERSLLIRNSFWRKKFVSFLFFRSFVRLYSFCERTEKNRTLAIGLQVIKIHEKWDGGEYIFTFHVNFPFFILFCLFKWCLLLMGNNGVCRLASVRVAITFSGKLICLFDSCWYEPNKWNDISDWDLTRL